MSKEHINGYAIALFSLAKEEKKLEKVKKDSLLIIESLGGNEEYVNILNTKSIKMEDKVKMISTAYKGVNKFLVNFMLLVVQKGKANLIVAILNKLISYINEDLNIKEGVVYSAQEMTSSEITKVQNRVNKILGFKVTLSNKIDAELISGIKIIVGDEVIEDSIQSRLEQIKYQLLGEEI